MIKSNILHKPLIYFVRCTGLILQIADTTLSGAMLDTLHDKNGIVIWENQGMFKLIPVLVLWNVLMEYKFTQQLKAQYPRTTVNFVAIHWNQGIDISPKVVESLLASQEECSGLTDTEGKTPTTCENQAD